MDNDKLDIVKLQTVLREAQHHESPIVSHPSDERINTVKKCQEACSAALLSLERLHQKFSNTLNEIRLKRVELNHTIQTKEKKGKRSTIPPPYPRAPHFMDVDMYKAPDNPDVVAIKRSGIPDLTYPSVVCQWSAEEKNLLIAAVYEQAIKIHLDSVRSKMLAVQRDPSSTPEDLTKAKTALNKAKNILPKNVVEPLTNVDPYDWELVSIASKGKHNATECRNMWRLLLHPQINKTPWTVGEVHKLRLVVSCHNGSDWEAIAADLGTSRSAYQCFVYYKMCVCRNETFGQRWTPEEDAYLFDVIEHCRIGEYIPWPKVAYFVQGRSKPQIYARWIARREHFIKASLSPEEQAVLNAAFTIYGTKFNKIVKLLPGRSKKNIAKKYFDLIGLSRISNHDKWSIENDLILLEAVQKHNPPIDFEEIHKKMPKNNLANITLRYNQMLECVEKKKQKDSERKLNFPSTSITTDFQKRLKKLKKSQGKTKTSHKCIKNTNDSREIKIDSVDKRLIRFFNENKPPPIEQTKESKIDPLKLKSILFLLGANLDVSQLQTNEFINSNQDLKKVLEESLLPNSSKTVKSSGIRTYSRKKPKEDPNSSRATSTSNIGIWSHESSRNTVLKNYFPPMLDTLLATRLISLLKHQQSFDLSRRNRIKYFIQSSNIDEHFKLWISRFNMIFKWPLILSTVQTNQQLFTAINEKKKLDQVDDINLLPHKSVNSLSNSEIGAPLYLTCVVKENTEKLLEKTKKPCKRKSESLEMMDHDMPFIQNSEKQKAPTKNNKKRKLNVNQDKSNNKIKNKR